MMNWNALNRCIQCGEKQKHHRCYKFYKVGGEWKPMRDFVEEFGVSSSTIRNWATDKTKFCYVDSI